MTKKQCEKPIEKRLSRSGINASTTVEASFVIPLIIISIMALFWLIFFMYARIKLEADEYLAARKAGEEFVMKEKASVDVLPSDYPAGYIEAYPYYYVEDNSIGLDKGKITVSAHIMRRTRFSGLMGVFTGQTSGISCSESVKYWDNPRIKRVISVVTDNMGNEEKEED